MSSQAPFRSSSSVKYLGKIIKRSKIRATFTLLYSGNEGSKDEVVVVATWSTVSSKTAVSVNGFEIHRNDTGENNPTISPEKTYFTFPFNDGVRNYRVIIHRRARLGVREAELFVENVSFFDLESAEAGAVGSIGKGGLSMKKGIVSATDEERPADKQRPVDVGSLPMDEHSQTEGEALFSPRSKPALKTFERSLETLGFDRAHPETRCRYSIHLPINRYFSPLRTVEIPDVYLVAAHTTLLPASEGPHFSPGQCHTLTSTE